MKEFQVMSGGKRANEEATGEGEGQVIIKRHKPNENTSSALVKKPSSSSGPVIKTVKN